MMNHKSVIILILNINANFLIKIFKNKKTTKILSIFSKEEKVT